MELCYANNSKSLFRKYAKLVTWFANTHLGRDYLRIPRGTEKIVRLDANSYTEFLGRERDKLFFRQAFYAADNHFERYLGLGFTSLEIVRRYLSNFHNAQEALAHYLGLRYAPQFPALLFAQTTFNALGSDTDIEADNATWATAHDATSGTVETGVNETRAGGNGTAFVIRRFFCRWNTSALTADATITAADLKIYVTAKVDNNSTDLDIVDSSATDGTLVGTDYDNLTATPFASNTLAGMTLNAYSTFTLDASGQSNISKTANSLFAWRIARDTDNSAPLVTEDNSITQQVSGDANPEQLVVTYTLPVTGLAYSFFI